jgi:hypothetical protein
MTEIVHSDCKVFKINRASTFSIKCTEHGTHMGMIQPLDFILKIGGKLQSIYDSIATSIDSLKPKCLHGTYLYMYKVVS